jgi:hypothetical protein
MVPLFSSRNFSCRFISVAAGLMAGRDRAGFAQLRRLQEGPGYRRTQGSPGSQVSKDLLVG